MVGLVLRLPLGYWYWLFFFIDDFFIVDEGNCLLLCFFYLYYLLLSLIFGLFVTPFRWWVCLLQGVLTNVTWLRSHFMDCPIPYSYFLLHILYSFVNPVISLKVLCSFWKSVEGLKKWEIHNYDVNVVLVGQQSRKLIICVTPTSLLKV